MLWLASVPAGLLGQPLSRPSTRCGAQSTTCMTCVTILWVFRNTMRSTVAYSAFGWLFSFHLIFLKTILRILVIFSKGAQKATRLQQNTTLRVRDPLRFLGRHYKLLGGFLFILFYDFFPFSKDPRNQEK